MLEIILMHATELSIVYLIDEIEYYRKLNRLNNCIIMTLETNLITRSI